MALPNQKLVRFGPDYQLSIIPERENPKLFEMAVLFKGTIVKMPGISDEYDEVTRFRTPQDVQGIMKKMHMITGELPENG